VSVFVLSREGKPVMPCSEKRARKLLAAGRARVHRMFPFAIRLVDRSLASCELQSLRLSLDPGSKVTGLALSRVEEVESAEPVMHIAFLMELVHRGQAIRNALLGRRQLRRGRRSRNTRYRPPRFDNRTRPVGWLAPSLQHRVDTTLSWVARLRRLAPITHLAQELVRFDMQAMQAEAEGRTIEGVQYQRGTLAGYEEGEYLLAKWNRTCAYCDAKDVPLEKDHIQAKSCGGSDRVSNLTLACRPCNQRKDSRDIRDFLAHDPARLARILAEAKAPLKDAAAVNSTRWALFERLKATGLPMETGSGGRTKFNRTRLGIAKTHALDAACVGAVGVVRRPAQPTLQVRCTGRGSRCRTRVNASGFPRGYLMREKSVKGFRTGDMVIAIVPKGVNLGVHAGRVAVRRRGSFNIQTSAGVIDGVSHKHCKVTMRGDGYGYRFLTQTTKESGGRDDATRVVRYPARS
jgi:5-methylcytosine-specific restriction endonuclease McrA